MTHHSFVGCLQGGGGDVRVPLRPVARADAFCAVIDRYGLHWMIEAGSRQ